MSEIQRKTLGGLHPAIITPIDSQGKLSLEHFPKYIQFQREAGVDGLVVCGTNGEATSVSVLERKQILECAIANRGNLTIIAGTGAANLPDTIELTQHAMKVGADAVLVLPPFFVKNPSTQGLEGYFRAVLDACNVPTLLYSIPHFSAVTITPELLERLNGHPNLIGVKDSKGNWEETYTLITRFPNLKIFTGSDLIAGKGFEHGAGVISGTANAFPELLVAVRDAAKSNPSALESAQNRLLELIEIVKMYPFVGNNKSILAYRGLPRLDVRPPLINLTNEQEQTLLNQLKSAGFLE